MRDVTFHCYREENIKYILFSNRNTVLEFVLGKSTVFEHYINKQKNQSETTKTQEKRGIKKTKNKYKTNKTKPEKPPQNIVGVFVSRQYM